MRDLAIQHLHRHVCAWCATPLRRKPKESQGHYEERRFCDRTCYGAWERGKSPATSVALPHGAGYWTPEALGALTALVCRTPDDEAAFARRYAAWRTQHEEGMG